jgi:hypothetical protein
MQSLAIDYRRISNGVGIDQPEALPAAFSRAR